MGDEQASCLQKHLQPSATRVPTVLLQTVEERIPTVRESLDCMLRLRNDDGEGTGTWQMSSVGVNEVVFTKGEVVTDIKVEEDPWPAASMEIKIEPDSCLDVLRREQESCAETCLASSRNGKQFVFVNVDGDTVIKKEEDPEPAASTAINNDPLNCVKLLRSDAGSCSETSLMSLDDEKWGVGIKVEEASDREEELNPQPEACQTVKAEPESTVNGQLCTCGGKGAASCNACNEAFVDRTDLETHKQARVAERPFSCDVCHKAFVRRSDLKRHTQLHNGERPFPCDVCHKAFARWSHLKRHTQLHNGERPFPCDVCHKAFAERGHLVQHKQIHSGERPFCCDVCNKAYVQRSDLMRHKQTHNGERPFLCDVCHKTFARRSHLIRHKQVHSGERPFCCDVCNKAFAQCSDLMRHKQVHNGERPFPCGSCHRAFARRSDLMRHTQIHNGELPFPCDVCPKAFARLGHFMRHKQIHNAERPSSGDVVTE